MKAFGLRVNSVVTATVLVIVYFVGVGMTSLIGKIARKEFIKTSSEKETYWINKKEEEEDHRRMF